MPKHRPEILCVAVLELLRDDLKGPMTGSSVSMSDTLHLVAQFLLSINSYKAATNVFATLQAQRHI